MLGAGVVGAGGVATVAAAPIAIMLLFGIGAVVGMPPVFSTRTHGLLADT